MTGLSKNRGRERITRGEGEASEFRVVEPANPMNSTIFDVYYHVI